MGTALTRGTAATVAIGGAGAFDAVVLAGVIAVTLAEIFGEGMERLGGGPVHRKIGPRRWTMKSSCCTSSPMSWADWTKETRS